jgi:hypothetical protein
MCTWILWLDPCGCDLGFARLQELQSFCAQQQQLLVLGTCAAKSPYFAPSMLVVVLPGHGNATRTTDSCWVSLLG